MSFERPESRGRADAAPGRRAAVRARTAPMATRAGRLAAALLVVVAALVSGVGAARAGDDETCWRDSYGRGVGVVPEVCDFLKEEKDGLCCYPKCKPGYDGLSFVCWQRCPGEFRNDGAFCFKPEPYPRGAGYPWKFGDKAFSLDGARRRCRAAHGECEKSGEIIYPKCRAGFHPVGCCICSPDCPDAMTDIGISCAKDSYTRTTIAPRCPAGTELSGLLCYPKCRAGYTGVGPVCWADCPASLPVNCGMSCAKSSAECALAVSDQVISVMDIFSNVVISVVTLGQGTGLKLAGSQAMRAGKSVAKAGARAAARAAARTALRKASKKLGNLSRAQLRKRFKDLRAKARRRGSKDAEKLTDKDIERMIEAIEKARGATDFGKELAQGIEPIDIIAMVDPTGIAAVVQAYNKPLCSSIRPSPTETLLKFDELPTDFVPIRADQLLEPGSRALKAMPGLFSPLRGEHPGRDMLSEDLCYRAAGKETLPPHAPDREFAMQFAAKFDPLSEAARRRLCQFTTGTILRPLGCYRHKRFFEGLSQAAAIESCRDKRFSPQPTGEYDPPRGPHPGRDTRMENACTHAATGQVVTAGFPGAAEAMRLTKGFDRIPRALRERLCEGATDIVRPVGCYRQKRFFDGLSQAAAVEACRDRRVVGAPPKPRAPWKPPPRPVTKPRFVTLPKNTFPAVSEFTRAEYEALSNKRSDAELKRWVLTDFSRPYPGRRPEKERRCGEIFRSLPGRPLTDPEVTELCEGVLDPRRAQGCFHAFASLTHDLGQMKRRCGNPLWKRSRDARRAGAAAPGPAAAAPEPAAPDRSFEDERRRREDAACRRALERGQVDWGGGTKWNPKNIDALCTEVDDAAETLGCFREKIAAGTHWSQAIRDCNGK